MIRRNCCSATSMPAAVQRLRMSPSCQRFTLRWVWRTISIMLSHGFVEQSVVASLPLIPSRISVSVSSHALAQRAGGVGPGLIELCRRAAPAAARRVSGSVSDQAARIRARTVSRSRSGSRSVTFLSLWRWQRCTSACSPKTSLIARLQRLGAVDHEQDRLLGIKAAVDEVGQQRPGERGVLGRALPEPERDLDALGGDPERDDVRAIGDLEAVEHHHRQAHVVQPAAHQLPQRGAGALDEHLRDRALAGRGGGLLDLARRPARRHRRTCASRRRRASGPSPPASAGRGRRSTRRSRPAARARRRPCASAAGGPHAPAAQASSTRPRGRGARRRDRGRACPSGRRPRRPRAPSARARRRARHRRSARATPPSPPRRARRAPPGSAVGADSRRPAGP